MVLWTQILTSLPVSNQSTQFQFDMHTIGHSPTYCTDFVQFRIYSSFKGGQKRILMHYGL